MVAIPDKDNLAISAIVTVGMQIFFFIIAAVMKFDKVTDLAGGANFVVLAVLSFLLSQYYHARQIAVTLMVAIWGARLAAYCLYRIMKIGSDERFNGIRESLPKFAIFWVFQAVWVFSVSLPMLLVNSPHWGSPSIPVPEFGTVADIVGTIMWIVGFLIEAVADHQKFLFRMNPLHNGRFCDAGLWSWTRHANYFGDILLWFGIFTIQTSIMDPRNPDHRWMRVGIISPLITMLLLLFFSGMPKLERGSDEKYGDLPEYQDYKNSVSPLIPMPVAVYSRLPFPLKVCLFEFPMYDRRRIIQRRRKEL
ncbi:hypothetical protein BV898_15608 [Hypsibius exemplaris]|uniref:Steroid 5-alpha reductase C-terminal domain-containing protein n=1 Tax=Hypsibius exemplaris TaxID=2072580 RepID=A0A9X6RKH5_HYPEX|nr:hypothetical protein BV898_15608 [Hypsibius exemplaris]